MNLPADFDPSLDLVLERALPVPVSKVWRAWTTPRHLMPWFCPRPWSVPECEIDLRPGGVFRTVMAGPEGERFENIGIYLEVEHERRLVWTDTLLPGYRPSPNPFFTAILSFEPTSEGTRTVAIARHGSPEVREKHEQMGFHEGWSVVLDQLVACCAEL
jgi:uncharacterized protein YndB with AHSA1/START domain